jgi:IS5 family transposase
MVPIGIFVARSFCAVIMGPMVLVRRWYSKSSKELPNSALGLAAFGSRVCQNAHLSCSLFVRVGQRDFMLEKGGSPTFGYFSTPALSTR